MIGVYLQLGSTSVEQYRAVDEKITEAGVPTTGLMLHTCFKEGDNLAVFDVWESKEAFEAFAGALAPIMQAAGGPAVVPSFVEMVDYDAR